MTRSFDHDCPRGIDSGAYVLRALQDDEAVDFGAHLFTCDHCRLEVAQLRHAVDALPMTATPAVPSAALKSRIMAVVIAEAELLNAAGPEADRAPVAPRPRRRWLPAFASPLGPAFAGALACALLALGVVGGLAFRDDGGGGGVVVPQTRTVNASMSGPAVGADAKLALTGTRASLQLSKMPSLSRGRVYQVWFQDNAGQIRPSRTLFNVRSDGRATVAIEESVKGVRRVLVTEEASGGAKRPTTSPVLQASLA